MRHIASVWTIGYYIAQDVCAANVVDMYVSIGSCTNDMQHIVVYPYADIVGLLGVRRCVRRVAVALRMYEQAEAIVINRLRSGLEGVWFVRLHSHNGVLLKILEIEHVANKR